jgi:hypothetical protein
MSSRSRHPEADHGGAAHTEAFASITTAVSDVLEPLAASHPERVGVMVATCELEQMVALFVDDLLALYEEDGFRARLRLDRSGLRAAIEGDAIGDGARAARAPDLRAVGVHAAGGRISVELVLGETRQSLTTTIRT